MDVERLDDAEVDCLRCETRMKDAGELRFREEAGGLGLFGLTVPEGRVREFVAYVCPKCGKVEFFV